MKKRLDVIIIGAGPAGLTGAIYLARAGFKAAVFQEKTGSNLKKVNNISNFLGFPAGVSGQELLRLGARQARKYGALIRQEEVLRIYDRSVEPGGGQRFKRLSPKIKFIVKTQLAEYGAQILLIASGMRIKSGGIQNEFKLLGKGVAICVACDGPFYKNKKVMVVGEGNLAAHEALELLAFTKKVVLNTNGARPMMTKLLRRQLKKEGVSIINKKITKALGARSLRAIEYEDGAKEELAGIFLATGTATALDFAKSLGILMNKNALKIDQRGRTNVTGIWAAGDVTGSPRQIGKAVGDGVRAAIDIIEQARGGSYVDHRED